jgi:tetratricopeptide (TPR) repeat protein
MRRAVALDRIADFLAEDILATQEEEILNEAADENEDVTRLAAEMRSLFPARVFDLYLLRKSRAGENVIPFPIQLPPEEPGREAVAMERNLKGAAQRRFAWPGLVLVAVIAAATSGTLCALWLDHGSSEIVTATKQWPPYEMPWSEGDTWRVAEDAVSAANANGNGAEPLKKSGELSAAWRLLFEHHLAWLDRQASLHLSQGGHGDAEQSFQKPVQEGREARGPRHPARSTSLDNLASLYQAEARYNDTESLLQDALQARRDVLGPRHPDTLTSINNLASLYQAEARYSDAEPLFQEALQARREVLGPRHPDTLTSIDNLASLYQAGARYSDAEPLFQEALQTRREVFGPRHPDTLTSIDNLALLFRDQARYGEAEPLLKEALQARREVLGPRDPATLISLNNLAELYRDLGRYHEAESLFQEALQANREVFGPRHPYTLVSLNSLGVIYQLMGRYEEAEPLLKEALQAGREVLGLELFAVSKVHVTRDQNDLIGFGVARTFTP